VQTQRIPENKKAFHNERLFGGRYRIRMPETPMFPSTLEKSQKQGFLFFGAYDPLGANQMF
jgi:hypothetical protein